MAKINDIKIERATEMGIKKKSSWMQVLFGPTTKGEVPAHWKEAIVVPILKKGANTDKNIMQNH